MKRYLQFALLLIVLTGCVSKVIEIEEHSPRLIVAQNSDGFATLIWESDSNYLYTIFYREGSSPWKELSSVRQVRGTGESMTATDRVSPDRMALRRYRVHFERPAGSRR